MPNSDQVIGLSDTDYVLDPAAQSCWVTVDHFSVYIKRTDEGVAVDIYPLGDECAEPIASTYAFTTELPVGETD